MIEVRLTLLRSGVQHRGSAHQLLEQLVALFEVRLVVVLFLLAERLEEWGDVGMEAGAVGLAQSVEILGKLLGELGEGALDEQGVGRGGHGGG
jgi:hypothetical protein